VTLSNPGNEAVGKERERAPPPGFEPGIPEGQVSWTASQDTVSRPAQFFALRKPLRLRKVPDYATVARDNDAPKRRRTSVKIGRDTPA